MTLRSSDLQSDSDLDSIRNSCDVFYIADMNTMIGQIIQSLPRMARNDPKWSKRPQIVPNVSFGPRWPRLPGSFFFTTCNVCNTMCLSRTNFLFQTISEGIIACVAFKICSMKPIWTDMFNCAHQCGLDLAAYSYFMCLPAEYLLGWKSEIANKHPSWYIGPFDHRANIFPRVWNRLFAQIFSELL